MAGGSPHVRRGLTLGLHVQNKQPSFWNQLSWRDAAAGDTGAADLGRRGGGDVVGGSGGSHASAGRDQRTPARYVRRVRRGRRGRDRDVERTRRDRLPRVRRHDHDAGEDRVVQGLHQVRGSASDREVRRGARVLLRRGSVQDGDGRLDGHPEEADRKSMIEPSPSSRVIASLN